MKAHLLVLVVVFCLLEVLDMVTAIGVLGAETNPLWFITRSFTILAIIKMVFTVSLAYCCLVIFNSHSSYLKLMSIHILVVFIAFLLLAIASNVGAAKIKKEQPLVYEQIENISKEEKINYYQANFIFPILFVLLVPLVSFGLWRIGNNERV